MAEVAHATQNRKAEFRRLLSQWNVRIAVALPALFLGIGSGITEPLAGLIIFLVFLLIGLGIVFWVASSRASKSFFHEYATARGLVPSNEPLGHQTLLLRTGEGQAMSKRWDGQLSPEFKGSVAHWSYSIHTTDAGGRSQDQWFDHTIVMIPIKGLESIYEVDVNLSTPSSESRLERLLLESQEFNDKYEVLVRKDQDPNPVRQLFSPSFIVWLTEGQRPFQFGRGVLITSRAGHSSSAAELDGQITGACDIARKLKTEAQEGA